MSYSASQAAKAAGVSVPTITRAIKNGKISAEKTEAGGYTIDPAELHRVFPAVTQKGDATPTMLATETPNDTRVLEVEVKLLRERIEDKDDEIADLRRRLDGEAAERQRLTALLTYQPETAPGGRTEAAGRASRSWWPFGRANR